MPNLDYFYPGIPTSLQGKTAKREWTNDDLVERPRLSMETLKGREGADPATSMQGFNEAALAAENPYEDLRRAKQTLSDTRPSANLLYGAGLGVSNPGDEAAAQAETGTRRQAAREVLDAGFGGMSFVPGPVGLMGRAGTSALGAYDMATQGPDVMNTIQAGAGLFDAIPAMRSLRNAQRLKNVNVGMHGPQLPGAPSTRGPVPYKFNNLAAADEAPSLAALRQIDDVPVAQAAPQMGEVDDLIGQMQSRLGGVPMSKANQGVKRLVNSAFGEAPPPSVSRMTAREALMDESPIGMTKQGKPIAGDSVERQNLLFGGASSREFGSGPEAGEIVRPGARTPIGKRPTPSWFPFGRQEAISWNP